VKRIRAANGAVVSTRITDSSCSLRISARTLAAGLLTAALAPWTHAWGQQFELLYSFCSQPNCADGSRPAAGLIVDEHGALYGTTNQGGGSLPVDFQNGTVFRLTPPATPRGAWTETVLYRFCSLAQCIDGSGPSSGLLMYKGALFGTTGNGGTHKSGAAFKLTPSNVAGGPWTYTLLYSFCSLSLKLHRRYQSARRPDCGPARFALRCDRDWAGHQ
jgi:hypothetical protein